MMIQKDQAELLCCFVEASRNTQVKEVFMASHPCLGETLGSVMHCGLPDRTVSVYLGDVEEMVDLGLLAVRYYGDHQFNFDVSTLGFQAYEEIRRDSGKPAEVVENEMTTYIRSREFQARHPSAYEKWLDADKVLWSKQTTSRSTEIGHLCREAMQEFAASLVERFGVETADANRAHSVARVKAVIDSVRASLGETVSSFLDSLLQYWGCAQDLVQRQEHAADREDEDMLWEDARRVVFQTLVTMHEVDRTLALLRR